MKNTYYLEFITYRRKPDCKGYIYGDITSSSFDKYHSFKDALAAYKREVRRIENNGEGYELYKEVDGELIEIRRERNFSNK